jgi:hypothetical protein
MREAREALAGGTFAAWRRAWLDRYLRATP